MRFRALLCSAGIVCCCAGVARAQEVALGTAGRPAESTLPAPAAVTPVAAAQAAASKPSLNLPPLCYEPHASRNELVSPDESFATPTIVLRKNQITDACYGAVNRVDETLKPGTWKGGFWDNAGRELGSPYTLAGGTALYALSGLASGNEAQVHTAGTIALGMIGTSATVQLLKSATGRVRPDSTDYQSFPSGHTANSFLVASVLAHEYGGGTGMAAYGVATFVGAARIFGGRHRFSDVLAGAVIGQLFGLLVTSRR